MRSKRSAVQLDSLSYQPLSIIWPWPLILQFPRDVPNRGHLNKEIS